MKKAVVTYLLILSTAMFASNIAIAGTYENLKCDKTNGECEFTKGIGKSSTKEFRGYCPYSVLNGMSIRKRAKHTTCTVGFYAGTTSSKNTYCSRSCTNWDPTKRDKVKVIVRCDSSSEGGATGGLDSPSCDR